MNQILPVYAAKRPIHNQPFDCITFVLKSYQCIVMGCACFDPIPLTLTFSNVREGYKLRQIKFKESNQLVIV